MSFDPAFLSFAQRQGDLLIARVISRDDLQLGPATLSKAAAARLRAGLRALEAYLRRLILCLALQLEPELQPAAIPSQRPRERKPTFIPKLRFRIFTGERDFPDDFDSHPSRSAAQSFAPDRIEAAPLVAKLRALKALLEDPAARARRLAFSIRRKRPGPLLAPGRDTHVPRRWGTELSALYEAMAVRIQTLSHERPPPLT
ncbi:MAG: hypothetical protein AAFZ91_01930 [Pseudomonadota bacterium]